MPLEDHGVRYFLIIQIKCRTLATLGALVIIFALALDPFFQQVVDYPLRWTFQGNTLVIHRVINYAPRAVTKIELSDVMDGDSAIFSVAAQFYYKNGTMPVPLGNGTRPDIPLSCLTSNCTWPTYQTLGVCSACSDISPLLEHARLDTRIEWLAELGAPGHEDTFPNGTVCGYFLNTTSSKPVLMSGYRINPNSPSPKEALIMRTVLMWSSPSRILRYGGSINFKHIRNPISDFLIVSTGNCSKGVYRNEVPSAQECVLSWCIKSIELSYYWGTYFEIEKSWFPYTTDDLSQTTPWETFKVARDGESGIKVVYNQDITISPQPDDGRHVTYGASNITALHTILVFDDIFSSIMTVANNWATPVIKSSLLTGGGSGIRRTPNFNSWLAPNNVTLHVEKLAIAITNVIRSSPKTTTSVFGMSFDGETCVSVRWDWLSLPLSLLFLGVAFSISTIMKSPREKEWVGIWKTSAVATFLYGER
ncbi:hypothetical protein CC78DRAFT_598999 [Lojkania enalia]|uniref:Uncharacterized protein n=1 Tax=Lojkania enalia TaxID=147567 RepID=A0A9P4N4Z8_9PLEO|nr:hypothetical protein CC78DRAFT_598999 [Didymosphaeria enalia]